MSSDEKESFEITDYDLETEFNPNRYGRKMTKNQKIYGIFAGDESDGESERPGFGQKTGGKFRSGFSGGGGVSFVSAGIQQPASKEDKGEAKDKKDEDAEPDIPVTDSSSEDEVQIMPRSFQTQKDKHQLDQVAGLRRQGGIGNTRGFEMYGIGAKLAEKMGFQAGKGLGKDLQGINAPIEAHVRKGRGAIGAYGKEKKTAPAASLDPTVEKSKPDKQVTPRESKWQKSGKVKQKVEYKYVTAEEVLQQKQIRVRPDAGHLAKVKVIDLTGPEQRILSGYHAISSGQKRPEDEWEMEKLQEEQSSAEKKLQVGGKSAFDMPELLHNIELLKDSCEHDIFKNERKGKYAADRKVAIQDEMVQLGKTVEKEDKMIVSLEDLIGDVKSLTEVENLDNEAAYYTLGKLKRDHPEEWELYQLYLLVPAVAIPIIKDQLKSWSVLENPQRPVQLLNDWATLLGGRTEQFELLLWEAWMPSIRQASLVWNVKDAVGMLNVVEFWKPMLPPWMLANLHDQIFMPRINQGVEDWDPLSDEIPIHSWIHPWIPYLGAKLEVVYPTIRRKLANALQRWHPSDVSGKQILAPWVGVFSKGAMETFLIKNIVPKLQMVMQELVIHPTCQIMEPWNWVMQWVDFLPVKSVVGVLENAFFPRWLQFLMTWLNQFPNYEEVQNWYTWWRAQFQEPLMSDPVIVQNLQKALEMIGTAIQCPGQPMDFSFIINRPTHQPQPQAPPVTKPLVTQDIMADALRMTSQVPHGFRDLVRMKCEELGIMLFPVANKYYEGKQVYKCGSGNLFIYISANVIYGQADGRNWVPISLNQLLQSAVS